MLNSSGIVALAGNNWLHAPLARALIDTT